MKKFFLVFYIAATLLALPVVAQANPMAPKNRFSEIDKEGKGSISKEVFLMAFPNMKEAAFDAIDTNKDGVITKDEWDAFFSEHSQQVDQAMPGRMSGSPEMKNNSKATKDGKPDLLMP